MAYLQHLYLLIMLLWRNFTYKISAEDLLLPVHCNEISIYVIPKKELRGLSPNFHIHVSVSDLYVPTIGPPIFLQQNRQTDRGNL